MQYLLIIVVAVSLLLVGSLVFITVYLIKNIKKTKVTLDEKPKDEKEDENPYLKDFFDINEKKSGKVYSFEDGFEEEEHTVGADLHSLSSIKPSFDALSNNASVNNIKKNNRAENNIEYKEEYEDEFKTASIEDISLEVYNDDSSTIDMFANQSNKQNIVFKYKDGGANKIIKMLGQQITVGRGVGNDLILGADSFTSRNHAVFYLKNDKLYVKDLGSKNGTYVNNRRIADEALIDSSCEVKFGDAVVSVIITQ